MKKEMKKTNVTLSQVSYPVLCPVSFLSLPPPSLFPPSLAVSLQTPDLLRTHPGLSGCSDVAVCPLKVNQAGKGTVLFSGPY